MEELEALSATEVRAATAAAVVTAAEPRSHGFKVPGALRGGCSEPEPDEAADIASRTRRAGRAQWVLDIGPVTKDL